MAAKFNYTDLIDDNVQFLQGTQAQLNLYLPNAPTTIPEGMENAGSNNTFKGRASEGAFYLTDDTDRLYIGKQTGTDNHGDPIISTVELNKSITTVRTVNDLPQSGVAVGQFYYITGVDPNDPDYTGPDSQAQNTHGGNILAVVTSVTNGVPHWVQVNPDTDTNTNDNTKVLGAVTAQDMVDLSVSGATDSGTVTRFVFDGIDGGGNSGNPVTAHYRLIIEQDTTNIGGSTTHESDVIAKLDLNLDDLVTAGSVSVDVNSAAASNGSVNVHTTSMPSAGFSITGTGNVDVNSSTANSISIHGKEYDGTLSSTGTTASATISYVDAIDGVDQTPDNISVAGDGKVVVNGSTSNQIGISHATSGVTAGTYGANNPTGDAFSPAGTIVIPQFTVDNTGHVTAASSESFTLPADTKVTGVSADNTGVITIANSDGVPVSSGQDLYYIIGQAAADGTVTSQTVYNKGNLGTYYTKTAIDSMLQGLDALTYKGTIGNAPATVQSLPAHPSNGDTYKVATADTYGDNACEVGDLLIATGDEYQDTDKTKTTTYVAPDAADHDTKIGTIVSPTWTLVSTGSDTDTTYTFGVNGTTLTYTPSTASGVKNTYATIEGGAELTASGSGTTITIDHDTQSGLAATQSAGYL